MLEETSLQTYAAAGVTVLLMIAALTLYPDSLVRWAQRKKYQYEVTFSLYMLTPTEKFIFNSVLFLFLSMVLIAASLYLPEHVATVARRAYYYAAGDGDVTVVSQRMAKTLEETATTAAEAFLQATANLTESAKSLVESATDAAHRMATGGAAPEL